MLIFEKEYSDESLIDIEGDVFFALSHSSESSYTELPSDEYGFKRGTFKVTITWSDDE